MKVYIPPARRPRIEMVPLIDSFFLLLAFFMSSVLTMEVVRGLPIDLPKAGQSAPLSRGDRLIVTLSREGVLQLDGEWVNLEGLRQYLSVHPHRSSLRLGIRADKEAPYEKVIQVLSLARDLQIGRVTLLTSPEAGRGESR